LASAAEQFAEKCFPGSDSPKRLQAAFDLARFTARVELVPFPSVPDA
jgi:hypothetical protein